MISEVIIVQIFADKTHQLPIICSTLCGLYLIRIILKLLLYAYKCVSQHYAMYYSNINHIEDQFVMMFTIDLTYINIGGVCVLVSIIGWLRKNLPTKWRKSF